MLSNMFRVSHNFLCCWLFCSAPFLSLQGTFPLLSFSRTSLSLIIISRNTLLLSFGTWMRKCRPAFFLHCYCRCTVIVSKCSLRSVILYLVTIWQNLAHYTGVRSFDRAETLWGSEAVLLIIICSSQELFCCFNFLSNKYFEYHSISGEIICSMVLNTDITVWTIWWAGEWDCAFIWSTCSS